MNTLQGEVYALLSALSAPVYYQYPQKDAALPCVCFRESDNRALARAGGREHLTALEYTVDAYAASPEAVAALAAACDTALSGAGLSRLSARNLYDVGARAHRKSMRYRVVVSAGGDKYQ